jgi:hypothetical protein
LKEECEDCDTGEEDEENVDDDAIDSAPSNIKKRPNGSVSEKHNPSLSESLRTSFTWFFSFTPFSVCCSDELDSISLSLVCIGIRVL